MSGLSRAINIEDLRLAAQRRLPRSVFDYIDGGADGEVTLRENCRAFADVTFRPRSAVKTASADLDVRVLDTPLSLPFIFAPVGSNLLDVLFQVAGQPTPAVSNGFGIVLSDVDVANATTIELFAQDGSSLGVVAAPVRTDSAGFSFVGVSFDQPVIARVRITLGTGALAADANDISAGGPKDLVVLDNLIYGEPKKAF